MSSIKNASDVVQRRKMQLSQELEKFTYGKLARRLGINKGVLWKFINTEYIPTRIDLKRKLGLPEPIIIYRTRNAKGRFEPFDNRVR